MNSKEKKINDFFLKELKNDLPNYCTSLRLQTYVKGKLFADLSFGENYRYYDLASLTKVIFTTTACMLACEKNLRFLDNTHLAINRKKFSAKKILNHTSGFIWWEPFFDKIQYSGDWQLRRAQLKAEILKQTISPKQKSVYSDVDFMRLGFLLEDEFALSIDKIWQMVKDQMGLSRINFHFNNQPVYNLNEYAPTFSHQWVPGPLQGVVNDANARALGGVSTHAGLFGPIDEVSKWFLALRSSLANKKSDRNTKAIDQEVVKRFFTRSVRKGKGDFALGFMMPAIKNASCGRYFSKLSLGHLGYTGTSVWWDPKKDLLIVVLANRVIPEPKDWPFTNLRSKLHDFVHQLV